MRRLSEKRATERLGRRRLCSIWPHHLRQLRSEFWNLRSGRKEQLRSDPGRPTCQARLKAEPEWTAPWAWSANKPRLLGALLTATTCAAPT